MVGVGERQQLQQLRFDRGCVRFATDFTIEPGELELVRMVGIP